MKRQELLPLITIFCSGWAADSTSVVTTVSAGADPRTLNGLIFNNYEC